MILNEIQSQIIRYCHRMDQKGWVANHDGNVSARLPTGRLIATPTGRFKGDLTEKDLIECDADGKKVSGIGGLFSEWAIHLRIYKTRPDVRAIIHSHAPYATAVGCAEQEMTTIALPEAVVSLGPGVPLISLSLPNSPEFFNELDLHVSHYDAILVGGNGVFSWGKTLEQAYLRMELVEHLARVFLLALPLRVPKSLSPTQVLLLLKKREEAGLALPRDPTRPHWFPVA